MGGTDAQLTAMASAEYGSFEPSWRWAFFYADAMTPTPGIVSASVYDAVAEHWTPAQVVEITSVICMFNFFNRFAHALEVPVTR